MILAAGRVRGEGGANTLSLPRGAQSVRLRVELPAAVGGRYRASVETVEGRRITTRGPPDARASGAGRQSVSLQLPARLFTPGDYILTLDPLDARGEVRGPGASYYFKVEAND